MTDLEIASLTLLRSPGHKEEEQLLSGEGATKAEETTSAAAGGSGTEPTVPTVETTGPADKTTSQPSAASPEEKILDLPTRQKGELFAVSSC